MGSFDLAKAVGIGGERAPPRERGLIGPVAGNGDAVHAAPLAGIVVEGTMLRAAVVPNGERADLPAEPAGELRLHRMAGEKVEQRARLVRLKAIEALRVIAEIERLAP